MMRLVHYSTDPDFVPHAKETVPDCGAGCFFYPEDKAADESLWPDRYRSLWIAPDEIIHVVQTFEAGEYGNENEVVEVFVRADDLARVDAW